MNSYARVWAMTPETLKVSGHDGQNHPTRIKFDQARGLNNYEPDETRLTDGYALAD